MLISYDLDTDCIISLSTSGPTDKIYYQTAPEIETRTVIDA